MTAARLTIRPRNPADDERLVQINRLNSPDSPPLSAAEMRHGLESQPEQARAELMVAEIEGEVVGDVGWNRMIYVENRDTWWSYLFVDPAHQRRGVGSELFRVMLESVRQQGAAKVLCVVREDRPNAVDFVRHRGFEPTGRATRLSALDVASARLEACRNAARRVEQQGIRIADMTELQHDDEAFLHALHKLSDETERDVPTSEEYVGMPFDAWRRDMFETPGSSLETFWVALDGDRPIGLAVLTARSDSWADNHYTGVARSHRGRGVARALKLRTVEWAQSQGIQTIITGNDIENGPMLAINVDLGYHALAAGIEMGRSIHGA